MTQKGPSVRWGLWLAIFVCSVSAQAFLTYSPGVAKAVPFIEYIGIVFIVLYAGLTAVVMFAFSNWLKFEGLPNARHSLGKIKEAAPPLPNIKALDAGRKLRQAEKDFVTLKNLHDNGLITDEMFLKRKAELKAALGSNEMFSKDDGPHHPDRSAL